MGNLVLENFLKGIADAIRNKSGKIEEIEAREFANEINNIPQDIKGVFQNKDIELTSASKTEINPDNGYDALKKVSVTPKLQSKSQTISANGTTTIVPDSGNVGLSGVTITTNINTNTALTFSKINGTETSGETKTFTIPAAKKYGYIYVCAIHANKCDISCTATNASVSEVYSWYEGGVLNGTTIVWPQKVYKITKNNTTTASTVSVTLSNCYSVAGRFYYCFY